MLRISIHYDPQSVTFRLEGKLAGSWVQELQNCWQRTLTADPKPTVRIDLAEVTFIDAAGKEYLAEQYAKGAELIATGCFTRAIVGEIMDTGKLCKLAAAHRLFHPQPLRLGLVEPLNHP